MKEKRGLLIAIAVPCLWGWAAEALWLVLLGLGVGLIFDDNRHVFPTLEDFVVLIVFLGFFPFCAVAMGIVSAYCSRFATLDETEKQQAAIICQCLFHCLPYAVCCIVMAPYFTPPSTALLSPWPDFFVTFLLGSTMIAAGLMPVYLFFAALFNLGQRRGEKWIASRAIPQFLGLENEWERSQEKCYDA